LKLGAARAGVFRFSGSVALLGAIILAFEVVRSADTRCSRIAR
jgi:hypothetical protein